MRGADRQPDNDPRIPPVWAGWMGALPRRLVAVAAPLLLWWSIVLIWQPEPFLLPSPVRVGAVALLRWRELLAHGATTGLEILLGFACGTAVGIGLALVMALVPSFGRWAVPVITASQSLPIFTISPLLVIWFGFGLSSKVVTATIIIFFPVASAFHDGLTRTDAGLLDLARLYRATPIQRLALIRLPAAMPGLVSGLRMGATVAPIGAIIGEWVGASSGLGLIMMQANARLQTDFMMAALALLLLMAIVLRLVVDAATRHLVPWAPETDR